MSGTAVQVSGIPPVLPDDRMRDKLTIHFLRPRNGGGELDRVLFPSGAPGQAFVMFQEPEVAARVLGLNHVMELEEGRFPLRLRAADGPETDLPVEASLSMTLFSEEAAVLRLVTSHGLQATEVRRHLVRVRGSFLQLRAARAQLRPLLLPREDQPPPPAPNPPPSPPFNGHGHSSGGASVHAGNWSPGALGGGQAASGPPSPSSSSPSPAPPRALPPVYRASPAPKTPAAESSSSFLTDADALRYAQALRGAELSLVLRNHGARMSRVETPDGADFSRVALEGGGAGAAAAELRALLTGLTASLRTLEVPLDRRTARRVRECRAEVPAVLIREVGGVVRLVGPPGDAHELKRRLLLRGEGVGPGERGGAYRERRSASLPRALGRDDGGDGFPAPRRGCSPPRHRDEAAAAGAAGVRGAGPAGAGSADRGRSSSERRGGRAAERRGAAAAAPRQGEEEQAPSGGGTRSPPEKKQSVTDWLTSRKEIKDIKQKLRNSKKK